MKVIKILTHILLTLLFVAYIGYQFRTDPIGILSGKRVTGEEQAYPVDWVFSKEHPLIAVETRVGNPHSVTTICAVHDGDLFIPAGDGSTKDWPQYVLADSRVRIKVGDVVYPAAMERVLDIGFSDIGPSFAQKYPQFAATSEDDVPPDIWLFRVRSR